MARYKHIDTSPRFIAVDLQRQLLPGSFEHALDHLIEHELDLSGFDARYRNDQTGASAYPPAMLLKVVLFAYSRGLVSSRGIERACREHITFIALSGDSAPHYTTLAAFVSGLGDDIAKLFAQVLYLCDREGLIGREMFAIPQGDFLRGVDRRQAAEQCIEGQERQPRRLRTPGHQARSRRDGHVRPPPRERHAACRTRSRRQGRPPHRTPGTRRRKKVDGKWKLFCLVHNIEKLAHHGYGQ